MTLSDYKPKLLVIDDDDRLRNLLLQYLQDHGYSVHGAADTQEGRQMLAQHPYDLLVLDVMLPQESGFDFTQFLRSQTQEAFHTLPILLLTARGGVEDRITGLELGADDYLAKPFEPKELLLRIGKILKRTPRLTPEQESLETFGEFVYALERQTLYKGTESVYLTSTETALLHALVTHKGVPLSRNDLPVHLGLSLSPRTLDVQITRLRKKIEKDPKKPELIKTIRHKGYAFMGF